MQEHAKQTIWISELEQRTREIGSLNDMSDLLQSCPTVEEAYSVIAEQSRLLFPAESGVLYMLGSSRDIVESVAAWGPPLPDPALFQPGDCWALRRGHIYHAERRPEDDTAEKKLALFCRHIHAPLPDAYTCVPLIAQGETLGVLHLQHLHGSSPTAARSSAYTEAKQQLIHAVADTMGIALSNLRLRESLRQESIHDPLTGMFNRRYMEESLERELHRSTRLGKPVGVMMLDIDHFKNFNDISGHDAGDAVLRELGPFLMSRLRAEDIACRYGGEEFALILPDASLETTRQRAEKIREDVKGLQVKYHRQLLASITLSVGVAEFPSHGGTGETVLRAADAALYRAKKGGRDQVRIAKSPCGDAAVIQSLATPLMIRDLLLETSTQLTPRANNK